MANVTWVLDPTHSEIEFKVRHMMISNVKGNFGSFEATILGPDFTSASVEASIATASIQTNNTDRDQHLKSSDFFDAEQFPAILFKSKKMTALSANEYQLIGDLSIKGISREVSLEVQYAGVNKDPWGNEKAGFALEGKINRKDWGLNWNAALETGGVLVSDEVKISGELQFVKKEQ